jgi:hypothetical protein
MITHKRVTRARVYKRAPLVERALIQRALLFERALLFGVLAVLAGGVLAGCGSSASHGGPSSRELALERTQLVQVSAGLRQVEPAVLDEVGASRAAWPSIANGLPRALTPALRAAVARASAKAAALPVPTFLAEPRRLTGPGAGIAGLYESYERLASPAWRLTGTGIEAIASGTPTAGAFARGNSTFYIDAIYDAHYNLSLVGKSLLSAYEKLGGAGAFGTGLPSSRLAALAAAYSIPAVRLEPHPAGAAKEG